MEHLVYSIGSILATKYDVSIIGLEKTSERIERNLKIYPFPKSLTWDPLRWRLKLLRTFIREEKPRAILSLSSIGVLGFATALSCNNTSVSSIVRITSDIFEVHKTQKPFTKRLKLFIKNNIFGRFALKIADKIVLLHDAQKSGLIKAGIDEEKMFTVSQPSTFFESVTERNREDLKLKVRGSSNVPNNSYLINSMIR